MAEVSRILGAIGQGDQKAAQTRGPLPDPGGAGPNAPADRSGPRGAPRRLQQPGRCRV